MTYHKRWVPYPPATAARGATPELIAKALLRPVKPRQTIMESAKTGNNREQPPLGERGQPSP